MKEHLPSSVPLLKRKNSSSCIIKMFSSKFEPILSCLVFCNNTEQVCSVFYMTIFRCLQTLLLVFSYISLYIWHLSPLQEAPCRGYEQHRNLINIEKEIKQNSQHLPLFLMRFPPPFQILYHLRWSPLDTLQFVNVFPKIQ